MIAVLRMVMVLRMVVVVVGIVVVMVAEPVVSFVVPVLGVGKGSVRFGCTPVLRPLPPVLLLSPQYRRRYDPGSFVIAEHPFHRLKAIDYLPKTRVSKLRQCVMFLPMWTVIDSIVALCIERKKSNLYF